MVCYGIFWSGQFSWDYMGNIPERMVDLIFFYHFAIRGSSHKKAPAPCHHIHTNDRKTSIRDFNISSLAIYRSLYSPRHVY